jgi:glutamate--cysteine ligase
MYFVYRDGHLHRRGRAVLPRFMKGKLPALPGEHPTLADWQDQTTVAFPRGRLKRYLEMRGADGGPWSRLCALPAFWVGLLYDADARRAAWDLIKDWTPEEHATLRREVPRLALNTPFRQGRLRDVALQALEISRAGLHRRAALDGAAA